MQALGTVASTGATTFVQWSAGISKMSQAQLANLLITNNQTLGYGALNAAEMYNALVMAGVNKETAEATVQQVLHMQAVQAGTVALLESATATTAAQVATGGLKAAIQGLGVVIQSHPLFVLVAAISAVVVVIKKAVEAFQKAIDTARELQEEYRKTSKEISDTVSSVSSLADEFNYLSTHVDENGKNISLSADEYSRYLEIVNQLVDINPALVHGYNDENNAIINRNTAIRETLDLLEQQRQAELMNMTSPENNWKVLKGIRNQYITEQNDVMDAADLLVAELYKAKKRMSPSDPDRQVLQDYQTQLTQIANTTLDISQVDFSNLYSILQSSPYSSSLNDIRYAQNAWMAAYNQMQQTADSYQAQMQRIAQASYGFDNLDDSTQRFVYEWINTMQVGAHETKTSCEAITDNIQGMITLLSTGASDADRAALQNAMAGLFSIDFDSLTADQAVQAQQMMENNINEIQKILNGYNMQLSNEQIDSLRASVGIELGFDINGAPATPDTLRDAVIQQVNNLGWDASEVGDLSLGQLKILYTADPAELANYNSLSEAIAGLCPPEAVSNARTLGDALADLEQNAATLRAAIEQLNSSQDDFNSWIVTGENLENLLNDFPSLRDEIEAYEQQLISATELQEAFNSALQGIRLNDTMSGYDSYLSALNSALSDMQAGHGLTSSTISTLAGVDANYADYLYEENGVLMLNTQAWMDNARARSMDQASDIQDKIDELEQRNADLRNSMQNTVGGLGSTLSANTAELRANQAEIDRLKNELGLLGVAADSVADSFQRAADRAYGFFNQLEVFQDDLGLLETARQEMAVDGKLSADTISSFANAREEYLDFLTVENGQVMLNTQAYEEYARAQAMAQVDGTDETINGLEAQERAIQQNIADLENRNSILQQVLNNISRQQGAGNNGNLAQQNAWNTVIANSRAEMAENQRMIDEATAQLGEVTQRRQVYMAAVKQTVEDYEDAVDSAVGFYAQTDKFEKSINALMSAQADMMNGGALSKDTIDALAEAESDYIDYLEVENGVVKLNTKAWLDNAKAKMQAQVADAQSKINDLYLEKERLNGERTGLLTSLSGLDPVRDAGTINMLNDRLAENEQAFNDVEHSIENANKKLEIFIAEHQELIDKSDNIELEVHLNGISAVEENIKKLSTVLGKVKDDENLTADELSGLMDEFGRCPSINEFIRLMSDSTVSMEEAQEAANKLAEEYLAFNHILDNINDETFETTVNFLKNLGVTNAYEVALQQLHVNQAAASLSAANLSKAEWEVAKKFLTQAGVTSDVIDKLQHLRQEQYNAKVAATDFVSVNSGTITSLIEEARAAGAAANNIAALQRILSIKRSTKLSDEQKAAQIAQIKKDVAIEMEDLTSDIKLKIDVPVPESSSKGSSKAAKEDYVAEIEKFRKAIKRLEDTKASIEDIEFKIDNAKSYSEQIKLQEKLIAAYQKEQDALHALNEERDAEIHKTISQLTTLGFVIEYNDKTNDLWVENLEHINDLAADSRKDIEEQIKDIEEWNKSNKENSNTWKELAVSIQDARLEMHELAIASAEAKNALKEKLLDHAIADKDLSDVKKYTQELTSSYKKMQDALNEEIGIRISQNFKEDSEQLLELRQRLEEVSDAVKDAKQKLVDYLIDISDAASEAVDAIQNVSDRLHEAADEYAANDGFISVDTFQSIIELGPQYMRMLENENGLLVINEERVNGVIAAKTRQLAVENAMAYVERIRLAMQDGSIEKLDNLITVTEETTDSMWGLVYANLALLGLDDTQYQQALHNINAMRSLAENAAENVGKLAESVEDAAETAKKALESTRDELKSTLDELNDMLDGSNDLMEYVMSMLKDRVESQIDAIEDMVDAYKELTEARKEALDAQKDEADYAKNVADKVKEIAKLQAKIDTLSLDDSRAAQAEKASLLEEMHELQESLNETQRDHSIEQQKESLDQMAEDYAAEKDEEIAELKKSISSRQKLWDMAIKYIREHYKTLKNELLQWNYDVGSSLSKEILEAFEQAEKAASRYGDFVTAIMGGIESEIESITRQIEELEDKISNMDTGKSDDEHHDIVGPSNNNYQAEASAAGSKATDIVNQMKRNSLDYWTAFGSDRDDLAEANKAKAQEYETAIGDKLVSRNGSWYSTVTGAKLYSLSRDDIIKAIVAKMKANAEAWKSASESERAVLDSENLELGLNRLKLAGVTAVRGSNGVWYVGNEGGEKLFKKYHDGGFVNNKEIVDRKEVPAILQEGELVLDEPKKAGLYELIDFADALAGKIRGSTLFKGISVPVSNLENLISSMTSQIPENITLRSDLVSIPPINFNLYNNGTLDSSTWNKMKTFVNGAINDAFLTVCKERG